MLLIYEQEIVTCGAEQKDLLVCWGTERLKMEQDVTLIKQIMMFV